MKRLFSSFALATASIMFAQGAKNPADYYRGQQGGVSHTIVEALQKDIPMAKRVLAECRLSSAVMERRSCASMVGHIGNADLADALRPYLKDENSRVRLDAEGSLVDIAWEKAASWIEPLLDDPDPFVRINVLTSYAYRGGSKYNQLIRRKLNDPDPETKLHAAKILARDGEAIPREFALAYVSSAALKTDRPVALNKSALLLLAHVGDERDFPLLETIYSRRDGLRWDPCASAAIFARQMIRLRLAKTAGERAEVMDEMLRDGTIRARVFEELTIRHKRGDESVRPAMEKAAADHANPEWPHAKNWLERIDKLPYR